MKLISLSQVLITINLSPYQEKYHKKSISYEKNRVSESNLMEVNYNNIAEQEVLSRSKKRSLRELRK